MKTQVWNGKGDRNRSISQKYYNGYDAINWGKPDKIKTIKRTK